jgi:hypothetical protein
MQIVLLSIPMSSRAWEEVIRFVPPFVFELTDKKVEDCNVTVSAKFTAKYCLLDRSLGSRNSFLAGSSYKARDSFIAHNTIKLTIDVAVSSGNTDLYIIQ